MSADNGRGANAVHGGRSAWTAEVELLAWSLRDGQLSFRHVCRTVPTDVCPHEVALGLAGFHEGEEGAFCHSTSWRCPTAGKLVLTYVSVPDPRPEGATRLIDGDIAAPSDGSWPQPDELGVQTVARHAARHLAMLANEDPTVRALVPASPALWEAIRRIGAQTRTSA